MIFIITVAMAAAGIILSAKLQKKYNHEVFSSVLYFQVFLYTFGFYGIWGQVLLRSFLPVYIQADVLSRIYNIALLLGLPFVIFAWMMMMQFSSLVSGSTRNSWFVFWFLFINLMVIIIIGYLTGQAALVKPLFLVKHYFIIANFVYTSVTAMQIYYSGKGNPMFSRKEKKTISLSMLIIVIVQSSLLILFSQQTYIGILFILAFFAGNTFLPVYLTYGTYNIGMASLPLKDITFEEFCKRYEVSPRESDIVREICNGLSNKEISERLFISLQTVKDHTHRIYIKTNVRSRVQLINLVKDVIRR